jgi:peptide/nickel transport system substrate-binding protein
MMYGPLLGVGAASYWFNQTEDGTWNYNGTDGLGAAVKGAIQGNDTTGYVAFNLVAPYVPFMQILTQGWAFIVCEKWCVDSPRNCINTTIALGNYANNFTEFLDNYQPEISPLMEPSVVGSAWPMMGCGPYRMITYNTDPHTGFQYYQRFAQYHRGWPCPGAQGYSEYVRIKIVEEWSNRKFQLLSTSSTQVDLTDVPRANCAELHTADKDSAVLPGLNLTKIFQQLADYYYFNYHVAEGSAFFPKWNNGTEEPYMFSDRDLREALMYCFNDSQFLHEYFLDEATQPSTYMCLGTAYYNASIPVRQANLANAIKHFKLAWGGQVWSQGITVKLVYNIGNIARQTIATMISDTVARINDEYGTSLNIVADGEPWATYLPAMQKHQLSCFTVGWLADYPDPDDWAVPFMDPLYGAYAYAGQKITYGLNTTSLNQAYLDASPKLTWGPIPYTNYAGTRVTGLNNTYVRSIIATGPGETPANRSKLYNELSDIFYAEAGGMPTDQGIVRHYERDWVHGWIGEYSMNPVSPGDYFYQMWKAPPTVGTPVYGVKLNALDSITNTTEKYLLMQNNASILMRNGIQVSINFTITAHYENTTVPAPLIIYATFGLKQLNIWTGEYEWLSVGTYTINRNSLTSVDVSWEGTTENGTFVISFRAEPTGAAGAEIYPSDASLLEINDTDTFMMVGPSKLGDIGTGYPLAFGKFDGKVTGPDLAMFLMCYKGTAPLECKYLGDVGTGYPLKFFKYDGKVTGPDLAMFLMCYKGTGP